MTSKNLRTILLAGVPALSGAASASAAVVPDSGFVWVAGKSTLSPFRCGGKIGDNNVSFAEETQEASPFTVAASVTVPVASLDCGDGTINKHMRKALKADANPTLNFRFNSYKVEGSTITLDGVLGLAGQEQPLSIQGTVTYEGGAMRVLATKQINMRDWSINPPKLMLGQIKVKENVTIGIDLTVARSNFVR